eukprot:5286269-Ditylum_brightwellii.AAC.1
MEEWMKNRIEEEEEGEKEISKKQESNNNREYENQEAANRMWKTMKRYLNPGKGMGLNNIMVLDV